MARSMPHAATAQPFVSHPCGPLSGRARPPGDKSISHRALMLGGLAIGESRIRGLSDGQDVACTAAAMRALGCRVRQQGDGSLLVTGVGVGGLAEPAHVLDLGNSGTSARLLAGLLASHAMTTFVTGDASLCRRPMARVTEPLGLMGAGFVSRSGGRLPMAIIGTDEMAPIDYALPVASAQVKSAILLAGLNTAGHTTVVEPAPSRDHTERMLRHLGATVDETDLPGGGRRVTLVGRPELRAAAIDVPGDVSAAAFLAVAAAIKPGSMVQVADVGLNPGRTGLIDTLREMGADLAVENARLQAGEPVGDLVIRGGRLTGVDVPAERAVSMIDEYPILAVAAACAHGRTRMTGLAELRVKESDRLATIAAGLAACGVAVEMGEDSLTVDGCGGAPPGGGTVTVALDHRIAMSFLVLGTASRAPVAIDDGAAIATSFPGFADLMNALGTTITEPAS